MASVTQTRARRRRAPERSGGLKRAIVWGALLGLAASALWFVFLRGDSSPRRIDLPQPGEITSGADEPDAPSSTGKKEPASIETFKIFAPKDPFDPLVETAAGEAAGGATAGSKSNSRTVDLSDSSTVTVGGHTLRLVQVIDLDTAQLQVDNVLYKIDIGQAFSETFKLVAVDGACVTALYGDEELSLCEAS